MRALPNLVLAAVPLAALCSCGGTPAVSCIAGTYLNPATAVADHAAASPGNQVQFAYGVYSAQGSCPIPQFLAPGPVVLSDTVNASASPTGVVTCLSAAPQAILVSPAGMKGPTRSATLTCR